VKGGEAMSKSIEERNEYLWDGTGEPDPEVARLEEALAQFRHADRLPEFPEALFAKPSVIDRFFRLLWAPRLAATALTVLAATACAILLFVPKSPTGTRPGWDVARIEGTPLVGTKWMDGADPKAKLEVGEALVTNGDSRATIAVADIGEVEVEPGSRVRLVQSSDKRKRIALDRGTIHAAIWAPPGEFVVDTPSAVAVDLGCAYTLHVGPDGSGLLRTTLGWVGFHLNGRDSFIPAGAMCPTRAGTGPGTPYFEDAPEPLREALKTLDFGTASAESRSEALRTVLSQARKKDALTLWHLLSRTQGEERERVCERFAELVPPPAGVTRDGVLRLDQPMLDLWWNALDLGDISIWRFWEQTPASGAMPAVKQEKDRATLKKAR
jgi:hypothetical protein